MVSYPDGPEQKSISDQLLLLLPSDAGLCVVMDTLYGFRSLDVLINHSLSAIKKASTLSSSLKVFVPKNSIQSAGTNVVAYTKALQSACDKYFPDVKIETRGIELDEKYAGYHEYSPKEGILISL